MAADVRGYYSALGLNAGGRSTPFDQRTDVSPKNVILTGRGASMADNAFVELPKRTMRFQMQLSKRHMIATLPRVRKKTELLLRRRRLNRSNARFVERHCSTAAISVSWRITSFILASKRPPFKGSSVTRVLQKNSGNQPYGPACLAGGVCPGVQFGQPDVAWPTQLAERATITLMKPHYGKMSSHSPRVARVRWRSVSATSSANRRTLRSHSMPPT